MICIYLWRYAIFYEAIYLFRDISYGVSMGQMLPRRFVSLSYLCAVTILVMKAADRSISMIFIFMPDVISGNLHLIDADIAFLAGSFTIL